MRLSAVALTWRRWGRGHSVLTGGMRLWAYSVYPLGWATLGWGRGPELLPSSRPLGRSGGVGLSWALGASLLGPRLRGGRPSVPT